MSTRPEVTLLVVDDDEVDRRSFKRGLSRAELTNPVVEATDGEEALAILRGSDGREALQPPYVVLLDLNMPRMGGLEFLDHLRADDRLSGTVVFLLTTSRSDRDREGAYQRHVAGYFAKESLGSGLRDLIAMLEPYLRIVELPG